MEVLHPNCAGLDVHKDTVVACSRRVVEGKVVREVRTFKTTTSELLVLSEWLASFGCTHIVMEATGVYWKCLSTTCRYRQIRALREARPASRSAGRDTRPGPPAS